MIICLIYTNTEPMGGVTFPYGESGMAISGVTMDVQHLAPTGKGMTIRYHGQSCHGDITITQTHASIPSMP